jgi:hypothetical protein
MQHFLYPNPDKPGVFSTQMTQIIMICADWVYFNSHRLKFNLLYILSYLFFIILSCKPIYFCPTAGNLSMIATFRNRKVENLLKNYYTKTLNLCKS